MKTVDIVERIEGEAKLNCSWENGIISDARIDFLNFRGFEYMLEGKAPLDSLIYTPRICGICGQAHLKATVDALENIYENIGEKLEITPKAKLLREIGLNIEIIDSHIKWFYMFILPDVIKLDTQDLGIYEPIKGRRWLESTKVASETIKALAIIGGQWPHTSYMTPGGVMSDPTLLDLSAMNSYLDTSINFFESAVVGLPFDDYLSFSKLKDLDKLNGDLKQFSDLAFKYSLDKYGKSYERFITLGESSIFCSGKYDKKVEKSIDTSKIFESEKNTFTIHDTTSEDKHTWSKSVLYQNKFYETGPLSRAMVSNNKFIKNIYKEYKDSVYTRVLARVNEIALLLNETKKLISQVDISQESYIQPKIDLKSLTNVYGESSIEATRGSLYHKLAINEGKIFTYNIITPTVWNLGPKYSDQLGIAQNAIIGSPSIEIAKIILRSFDVCSVCTTH
mgnify:CR=1 FL=1